TLFNQKTGLSFVCPITNTYRNIPLHVTLPEDGILSGVIMVDQMKSVDYRSRKAKFIDKAPIGVRIPVNLATHSGLEVTTSFIGHFTLI
ncbi:MAG: type II toxin-antitoxin system PemK/MazF family toxin, partial [Kosmotogaceae bacterium]